MGKVWYLLVFLSTSVLVCSAQENNKRQILELQKKLKTTMRDSSRVSVLNKLAQCYVQISNQLAYPKAADSAQLYAHKALTLGETLNSQKDIAQSFVLLSGALNSKYQNEKAASYAKMAIEISTKSGDKNGLADAYQALVNTVTNPVRRNQELQEKTRQLYKESNNKKKEAEALLQVAQYHENFADYDLAIKALEECLVLHKSIGNPQTQEVYAEFALVYYRLGNLQEALRCILICERLIEEFHDQSSSASQMYLAQYEVYKALNEPQKAYEALQKAYKIAVKYNDRINTAAIQFSMISALIGLHREKEAHLILNNMDKEYKTLPIIVKHAFVLRWINFYTKIGDYANAKKYLPDAILFTAQLDPKTYGHNAYPALSNYYLKTGQFADSRRYAELYSSLAEKTKNKIALAAAYGLLFKLDSVDKKYDAAIRNLKLQSTIADSVLNKDKNKQIAELQVKYDTYKKDKNLLIKDEKNKFLVKQSELQQSRLQQSDLIKNISISGLILLLIIAGLLWRNYQIKTKSNGLLELQKEEINQKNAKLTILLTEKELLNKEIHHRVKNNLQIVMSLLNTQSRYLKDNAAIFAIKNTQHRINSMALIHKKLYQSDDIVSINIKNYIEELIEYLALSFDTGERISFKIDVLPIELDTTQAIPIGLILNEVLPMR